MSRTWKDKPKRVHPEAFEVSYYGRWYLRCHCDLCENEHRRWLREDWDEIGPYWRERARLKRELHSELVDG